MIKNIIQVIRQNNGYTLAEMLTVIFVFTLVWIALAQTIMMLYRMQGFAIDQTLAVEEARRGVDQMAREIRQAVYGENGAYPIELAAGKEFIFTAILITTAVLSGYAIIWQLLIQAVTMHSVFQRRPAAAVALLFRIF